MTRLINVTPSAAPQASDALISVDRAIAEIRRGAAVALRCDDGQVLHVLAAEAATTETLAGLREKAGTPPALVLTARRAAVLNLAPNGQGVLRLELNDAPSAEAVAWLADPVRRDVPAPDLTHAVTHSMPEQSGHAAAIALTKLARLLPAALVAESNGAAPGMMCVDAQAVRDYPLTAAQSLRVISQARVPLKDAENARIIAFRPADGGIEHLAIVIGEPDAEQPVLARLHSECFTGDLLGSLRCDCGDQLRGALAEIAEAGSGILLYLAQEGRGIGLVNKLRAYQLQDEGFDTLDANGQLGFDDDERIYQPAAQMLRLLGVTEVRLLTNNPLKVEALARHQIQVSERVPHVFPANDHNQHYLRTKAQKGGHLF